ncbi:MAG: FIST C-terminal domain-containing protein [Rhodospirillales bacterium]|nr:FIST C-terminal domain-containing protein [Rhodospirillales bacterium]
MTGISHFRQALSQSSDWVVCAREIEDQLLPLPALAPGNSWLAFIYATDVLAEQLSSILVYLKQKSGISHWVGSVGAGICAGRKEIFGRAGLTVMVAQLPATSFRVIPTLTTGIDEIPAAKRQWSRAAMAPFGVVHGDPSNGNIVELIEMLAMDIENMALDVPGFLVGGLSASQQAPYQVAQTVTAGGLSGVLFGPDVEVATALSQGCSPVGPSHRITDARGGVILELDGRRGLEVFKEDIGELLARDLMRVDGYIHAALPVSGSDTGDYVVRGLLGVDPENGWLAIAGDPQAGDQLMFVRRDPKAAEEDLLRMAVGLKRRLPGVPKGGLYFSCVGRGPGLFGREGAEMEILARALGDFPLVGFFGNGEISNNRLYGYTGVLCLFV